MLRLLSIRVVAVALAGLAAGAGGGFALGGGVGGSVPASAAKVAALDRLMSVATTDSSTEPAPAPPSAPLAIPGQMLASDAPVPIPPAVLRPRNGWLVSDGMTLVAVYAGTAGDDSKVGRIVIVPQNLAAGQQRLRVLDARSTGGLTITAAPIGRAAERSVRTGNLRLRTNSGGLLTLDLGTARLSQVAHRTQIP